MGDKDIKRQFKGEASKNPEKYYAVRVLKEEGFQRRQCATCGTWFWSVQTDQNVCGDPSCSGGFRFINGTPAKNEMTYIEVWKTFSRLFKKWGYTPIPRYPVVARWRDDTDFVQASIYDFQPYVVSGEVSPPANPLVVPQFSLRFNDIDNVGITGAHYTGFVMIGQHAFMQEKDWDQEKYFRDIHRWLTAGIGLPNSEITYHEDAWAGGGNYGPCMEFFSRGLELGNQVYMMYEQTPTGGKPLKLRVLDMGMGHERNAWFTKGTSTSYESVFPTVTKKLRKITGVKFDEKLMQRFLPYSSYLNIDEIEDITTAWGNVAGKLGMDTNELRTAVLPLAAQYSVGEHARSLLVALTDGALPSNVGGGYNLRVILRRALGFIDKYGWDIDIGEVCAWHATYLKPLFPELAENLEQVQKILAVEKAKFSATREKSREILVKLSGQTISTEKLIELYDSHGISPAMVEDEGKKLNIKVKVPEDFFMKVAERHENQKQEHATGRGLGLDLSGIPPSEGDYFGDYLKTEGKSTVLKIIGTNVVLDTTIAYPTSGGQLHDIGSVGGIAIVDVIKQGPHIIHVLAQEPSFTAGEKVDVVVDKERRKQLAQHHSATHILNVAARIILGNHINQAGAKKGMDKAHLDITHYESLTDDEVKKIEKKANEIVCKNITIEKRFMSRGDAEKDYGMRIYQGGAVPGKNLRIVNIPTYDVEACGGTHLNTTGEVGTIKIIKTTKIQDGIVRITFTAGGAAEGVCGTHEEILAEAAKLLGCRIEQLPGRCEELFLLWKKAQKLKKKGESINQQEFTLGSQKKSEGDILAQVTAVFRTQPEHIIKTIKRFLNEIR